MKQHDTVFYQEKSGAQYSTCAKNSAWWYVGSMAKQKGRRGSPGNLKSKTEDSPKDPRLTLQLKASQRAHIEAAAAKERLSAQNFARQAALKRADDVLGRTVTEPGPEWADK